MKTVTKIKPKIVIFTAVKKTLYVAWACFRNGQTRDICVLLTSSHFDLGRRWIALSK